MGSIIGRESEEIRRLEEAIAEVLELEPPPADLAATLRDLRHQIELARERYWSRARDLHAVREALKASG